MAAETLGRHLSFMRDLEKSLEDALKTYADATDSELEELRHMKREVQQARRSIFIFVEKQRAEERKHTRKLEALFVSGLKSDMGSGLLPPETVLTA